MEILSALARIGLTAPTLSAMVVENVWRRIRAAQGRR
jgi:hypothetical protein